ncbi:MAG: hypothetical protein M3O70_17035 [Actinomycetota bacterium]|nr:hypothetical protein [Actinomycetota bacterium]
MSTTTDAPAPEVTDQPSPSRRASLGKWGAKLRKWAAWFGFFVVGVMVGAGGGSSTDALDAALTAQESAEAKVAEQMAALSAAEQRADTAESARAQAEAEVKQAREKLEAEYAEKQADLDRRAAQLDEREAAVIQQEQIAAKSTFGDGVYEVGVDIVPGKYKTEGGRRTCYWQKSPVAASDDIIDNGLVRGPTTVVIEDGILFTSQDCGTWTRVG